MDNRHECCGNLPPCGAACAEVHENSDCAICQGGSYTLNTPAPVKEGEGRRHELKTWPEYFAAIQSDAKTFEVRRDDRDFREGDVLVLREWNPRTEEYSGAVTEVDVRYLLPIAGGYVVMSVARRSPAVSEPCRIISHCIGVDRPCGEPLTERTEVLIGDSPMCHRCSIKWSERAPRPAVSGEDATILSRYREIDGRIRAYCGWKRDGRELDNLVIGLADERNRLLPLVACPNCGGPLKDGDTHLLDQMSYVCEQAPAVSGEGERAAWISVTDRLPKDAVPVLLWAPGLQPRIGWKWGLWRTDDDNNVWTDRFFTHWMPLPDPPAILAGKEQAK